MNRRVNFFRSLTSLASSRRGVLALGLIPSIAACVTLLFAAAALAEPDHVIPNDLRLTWPNDLTYIELPADEAANVGAVSLFDPENPDWPSVFCPVQVEEPSEPGGPARVWFLARITAEKGKPPAEVGVKVLGPKKITYPIRVYTADDEAIRIDNGKLQVKLRQYPGKLDAPTPLRELPHWLVGAQPAGTETWDGRAWFDGPSVVTEAHSQIIARGPVFVDVKFTYVFADAGTDGETDALPLAMGKQCHAWEPSEPPRESVPKHNRDLELIVRVMASNPWVEVNERFHFPDADAVTQHLHFGKPPPEVAQRFPQFPADSFAELDTITWEPWFEYDRFGGNSSQKYAPAEPRPAQKARPFANVQARWTQRGGGSQDFVITLGGPRPYTDKQTKQEVRADNYDANAPAFGVASVFASKWIGPYRNTIHAHALNGHRARIDFRYRNGSPQSSGLHYGQRAYALLIGPRSQFHNLTFLIRRHTDWTLVAQHHDYILDWDRDPAKAGPSILVPRAKLEAWRQAYADKSDAALVTMIDQAKAQRAALREQLKAAEEAEDKARVKQIKKQLNTRGFDLLDLITDPANAKRPRLPQAGLWIGRRYQNDFLNPTSQTTRGIIRGLPNADLFANGRPMGGRDQAVIGYVFTDLDHWPGWHGGWSPGNPNFRTDKYMPAAMAGAALRDHPHAERWLEFGYRNFLHDLRRVFYAPDGVGYECPGYAGYSMKLQIKTGRLFYNAGFGNALVEQKLVGKSAEWHRHLITPYDARLGLRHEAPIGDTHRWTAGLSDGFAQLAPFFSDADPAFAAQLVGTYQFLYPHAKQDDLFEQLIVTDPRIRPTPAADMDWTGRTFFGFGAIMRDKLGPAAGPSDETFLSFKAGHARGHAHNEELSWHFYSNGTPISLDYNCSYSPRMDHSAMHNSMTFGHTGTVTNNQTEKPVEAMEEIYGTGYVGAFTTTPAADLVVAERKSGHVTMRPPDAGNTEFARGYPRREVDEIVHRRFVMLVKHPAGSPIHDYLVIRDETTSAEPQQINAHLLAREAAVDGDTVTLPGQWDKDMVVKFITAEDLKVDVRGGWYRADYHRGHPVELLIEPGESTEAWAKRLSTMDYDAKQVRMIPDKENPGYGERIAQTQGKALIPPPGWDGEWKSGEYQVWLRCHTKPGSSVLWVIVPYAAGGDPPRIERSADGAGLTVSVGEVSETIMLPGTGAAATITRDGQTTDLLAADALPPLGQIENKPLASDAPKAE